MKKQVHTSIISENFMLDILEYRSLILAGRKIVSNVNFEFHIL